MMLRDVMRAAWGKMQFEWSIASSVICKIHNVNCGKQSELKKPRDFNPYLQSDDD